MIWVVQRGCAHTSWPMQLVGCGLQDWDFHVSEVKFYVSGKAEVPLPQLFVLSPCNTTCQMLVRKGLDSASQMGCEDQECYKHMYDFDCISSRMYMVSKNHPNKTRSAQRVVDVSSLERPKLRTRLTCGVCSSRSSLTRNLNRAHFTVPGKAL